jgi:hypothetical protein
MRGQHDRLERAGNADAIEEPRDRGIEGFELAVISPKSGSDLGPESRFVSLSRVTARPCADDLLALPTVGGTVHAVAIRSSLQAEDARL